MAAREELAFLEVPGAVARLIREGRWDATALGRPEAWPQSLRSIVGLMLHSKFPMFLAWGPSLALLYNDAYVDVLGAKHPAALGRPFEQVWSEIWSEVGPLARRALAGEATYLENLPLTMHRKGYDEPTWFTFSYSPVPDESGRIAGMHCVCTETTSAVVAETARRANMQQLEAVSRQRQLALDAARLGWWQYDQATGRVEHDIRYAEIYGLDGPGPRHVDEINALLDPADAPRVWAAVQAATDPDAASPYRVDYRIRRPDGEVRWLEARGIASFEADGDRRALAGFVGTVADITQQREFEDALRESEARFRLTADASPVILWLTDPSGHCTFLSREWYDVTGQTEAEALGLGWTTATHPDDQELAGQAFLNANATRSFFRTEYRLRTADGSYRWAIDLGRPWFLENGEYAGMVGAVVDIDDRKRAEQGLEEAGRRKDQFLATLAHELRNPLAPISNALQVWPFLETRPEEAARIREMMGRQVRQMVRLVDDLLDVSRITRGRIELTRERVDLRTVIAASIEPLQPFIDAQRHELVLELPDGPLMLEADTGRLMQVFGNVLHNAAKYTPPGGHIRLRAIREAEHALVTITDDGAGIPVDMLASIFDVFTQVDHSLARSQGGLGIGLTLVKNLVELHDGHIEARSDGAGRGSEFRIRLPLAERAASAGDTAPAASPPLEALPRRRVLVVDDVEPSAHTLALMLESLGQAVVAVHDGASALAAFSDEAPDIAFIDVAMPGMDGHEVAGRIRSAHANGPVLVALTGFGQEEDRHRALRAGFDHHLIKPTTLEALHRLLAQASPRGRDDASG